ncbi:MULTISPECIES: hypothetical protein [Halococcus]|uniref:DUF8163 domain-containing protein n=1 Tax=Halococcus salifodinae DSM 8989 TaxID=1227456 RepID=M0N958_9EURY|nr:MULTISPECIES: hypothetical protein [Halococcus]EMA53634.1 hypothetical protein C450_06982 [Halococcus salifodinae DSM 8989]
MTVATRRSDFGDHSTVRKVLATLGTVVATAALGLVVGPVGVLVAVGIGSAQFLVSTTAAFATGQIVLAALYPPSGSPVVLVLAEIGLLCVLFSSAVDHHDTGRLLTASLVAGVAIGGSGWLALRSSATIWIGASVIVAGTAFVAYGLHRYERVHLGLVETP